MDDEVNAKSHGKGLGGSGRGGESVIAVNTVVKYNEQKCLAVDHLTNRRFFSVLLYTFLSSGCQSGLTKKDIVPEKEPIPVTVTVKQKIYCACGGEDKFVPRPTPPYVIWGHPHKTDLPDAVWVGMKPQDYGNIAGNISDIKARAKQFHIVEQCYVDCIDDHNQDAK